MLAEINSLATDVIIGIAVIIDSSQRENKRLA